RSKMNQLDHGPAPISTLLQVRLDRLNAAFSAFKKAEEEIVAAEQQQDGDKLIRLWYAKNQSAQAYMQEWDYLSRYVEIIFDEYTRTLYFSLNPESQNT